MFERFTDRARRVVVLAQEEARMLNHNYIGTEHILLGLIHEGEGVAAKALESLGISLEAVRAQVEEIIGHGGQAPSGHIPFTPRAKKGFELALREAARLGQHIGTGHLLLGLIGQADCVAVQVLGELGVDLVAFRARVIAETESRPEGLEYSPVLRLQMRPRRMAVSDPVRALLDSIDDRLSAIERHLGMDSGGPGNVVPPS